MVNKEHHCERCGELLREDRIVWLELSNTDGQYYTEIPDYHKSQGAFPFGKDCARRQIGHRVDMKITTR